MKEYEDKVCPVCGKAFTPKRGNQKLCGDPECIRRNKLDCQMRWYRKNYLKAKEQKREYMERVRKWNKRDEPHVRKPDTIVAIGYADRQREATLKMVGKVKVEL